jgi:hypothetical protein
MRGSYQQLRMPSDRAPQLSEVSYPDDAWPTPPASCACGASVIGKAKCEWCANEKGRAA